MVRYVAGHCGAASVPAALPPRVAPAVPTHRTLISPPQLLLRRPTKQSNPPFPVVSSFRFVFCVWTCAFFRRTSSACIPVERRPCPSRRPTRSSRRGRSARCAGTTGSTRARAAGRGSAARSALSSTRRPAASSSRRRFHVER